MCDFIIRELKKSMGKKVYVPRLDENEWNRFAWLK